MRVRKAIALASGTPFYGMASGDKATAQTLTSQDVLQNATSLSFSVGANERWVATFYLDVGALLATTGLKIALNAPSGATINFSTGLTASVVTALNVLSRRTTVIGTALDFSAATLVAMTSSTVIAQAWVSNGATAGTAQLQFAQSTSSGSALSIQAGSYFTAVRIA